MNHTEFLQEVEDGFKEDWQIADYLTRFVLEKDHKMFLRDNEIGITDLLKGRYPHDEEMSVIGWMVSVNNTIGGKLFKW